MRNWQRQLSMAMAIALFLNCFLFVHMHKATAVAVAPDISDDFSADSGLWTLLGNAQRSADGKIMLTDSDESQIGTIWLNQSVSPPYAVDFRFQITKIGNPYGDYNGADGIVFMFNKEKNTNAVSGGGMGFEPNTGYGIEFDTWLNEGWDETDGHIALIEKSPEDHLISVPQGNLEDSNWHDVRVIVEKDRVVVYMDNVLKFDYPYNFDPTYSGLGFSASTGAYYEEHWIDDVSITKLATVQNVSTTAVDAGPGDIVPIDVVFSKPVEVTGTPELRLNHGGIATFASNEGGGKLRFQYTLQEGDNVGTLDYDGVDALMLDSGGSIITAGTDGLPADISLPASGIVRTGLTITPSGPAAMNVGETLQLAVSAKLTSAPASDVTSSATYSSDNEAVAMVSNAGLVEAVGVGTAEITASYGGMTAKLQVAADKELSRIEFGESVDDSLTLAHHETSQLQVTAVYADGSTADITGSAAYTSDNSSVSVTSGGLVKAESVGSATITVQYRGESLSLPVTTTKVLSKLEFGSTMPSVFEHLQWAQLQIMAVYSDDSRVDVTADADFDSSSDAFEVSETGLLTAAGTGEATITIAYDGKTLQHVVTSNRVLTDLKFGSSVPTGLNHHESFQLHVEASFSNGDTENVTAAASYHSSNSSIIVVSASGQLMAVGVGTATITVQYGGRTLTESIESNKVLTGLEFESPVPDTMDHQDTHQLQVMAMYSAGPKINVTADATFSSSNDAVIEVSPEGLLTAVGVGTAKVTAEYEGLSIEHSVTSNKVLTGLEFGTPVPDILNHHQTLQLQIMAVYSAGPKVNVTADATYHSSSASVIEASSSGLLTAASLGKSTITVQYGSQSLTKLITTNKVLTGLEFGSTVPDTLNHHQTFQLQVMAAYSDNTKEDVTADAIYGTSSGTVIDVSPDGLLTAVGVGPAEITIEYEGKSLEHSITSNKVLNGLEFGPSIPAALTLEQQESFPLQVMAVYSAGPKIDVTGTASYNSSNSSVATVDNNGTITAGGQNGTASIWISYGGLQNALQFEVTVRSVEAIAAVQPVIILEHDRTEPAPLPLVAIYSDGTSVPLESGYTLQSSDEDVVEVDGGGLLVRGTGTAVITVHYKGRPHHAAVIAVHSAKPDVSFIVRQIALGADVDGDGTWTADDARMLLSLLSFYELHSQN